MPNDASHFPPFPPALHLRAHHTKYRGLIRWPALSLADAFVNRAVVRFTQQMNHGGMNLLAISARTSLDNFLSMSADQLTRYAKAFLTSGQPLGLDEPREWAAKDVVVGGFAVFGEKTWFPYSAIDEQDLRALQLTAVERAHIEREQGVTAIDQLGMKLRRKEVATDTAQRAVYEVYSEDPSGKEDDRLLTVGLTYDQAVEAARNFAPARSPDASNKLVVVGIRAVSAAERHPHLIPMLDALAEIGRVNERHIADTYTARPN